jgi:hypothetical protein
VRPSARQCEAEALPGQRSGDVERRLVARIVVAAHLFEHGVAERVEVGRDVRPVVGVALVVVGRVAGDQRLARDPSARFLSAGPQNGVGCQYFSSLRSLIACCATASQ